LKFFHGGWDSPEGCNFLFANGSLWFGAGPQSFVAPGQSTSKQCVIDERRWLQFWSDVERLGVWEWKWEYRNETIEILDGEFWHLELEFNGRRLKSEGDNAYPGVPEGEEVTDESAFGQFVLALRRLTGINEI
jgi:hypothetical protein